MIAYFYDKDGYYTHCDVAVESTVSNTTSVKPADGLYDPKWNGSEWVGKTLEQFIEDHKDDPQEPALPTVEQQQIAELIKSNAQQMALNAQLIKQLFTLQTSQATQTAQTAQAVQAAQTQTTQEAE